jgi:hypothetical protein
LGEHPILGSAEVQIVHAGHDAAHAAAAVEQHPGIAITAPFQLRARGVFLFVGNQCFLQSLANLVADLQGISARMSRQRAQLADRRVRLGKIGVGGADTPVVLVVRSPAPRGVQ